MNRLIYYDTISDGLVKAGSDDYTEDISYVLVVLGMKIKYKHVSMKWTVNGYKRFMLVEKTTSTLIKTKHERPIERAVTRFDARRK